MSQKEIKILEKGKIEIENSYIKCFLGKGDNYKSSEDLRKEIPDNSTSNYCEWYEMDNEKYQIYYPIPKKNISIILKNGKKYKSDIYFVDDIKNIISGLNMENPCFLFRNKYLSLKEELERARFLTKINLKEIKDIGFEEINFDNLKVIYEKFEFKGSLKLKDINNNISIYSKIDNIGEQEYYSSQERTSLGIDLDIFNCNQERKDINDIMYGIFGNYASGKSFFLINYNYISKIPSIYLNVKYLKDASETKGFSNLLNNEIIILFKKLNSSFKNFKNFISKFIPYKSKSLDNLLLSIIKEIKKNKVNVIIDQYQEEIFENNNFIIKLKEILLEKDSNIKVIISSSINNEQSIKKAYLNQILENDTDMQFDNLKNENEDNQIKDNEGNEVEENEDEENDNNEGNEIKEDEKNIGDKNNENKDKGNKINDEDKRDEKNKNKINEDNIIEKNDKKNKKINKMNDYIPYHLIPKLLNDSEIKDIMKKKKLIYNKDFEDKLKLFNYLPLYYNLCLQQKDNLNNLVDDTKRRIEKKIYKFYNNNINVHNLDQIRKMIDDEITISDISNYSEYIPFKYFNIEKKNKKYYLRTHFPLIKEILEDIIMKESIKLFDGEIKYNGNVIGSFLELNIINNIKNKNIKLDIDAFVKVDSIHDFGKIIEEDTDNFTQKNIFITQKNENGPYYDLAYLYGKNTIESKIVYIQVKKGYTNNKINNVQMKANFEEKLKNIEQLFKSNPKEAYLVYITLINDKIKNTIIEHNKFKRDKNKRVTDLGKDSNSLVYSINELNNFCSLYKIPLYYYEPNTHLFYIKNEDNFVNSDLNLFTTNNQIKYDFSLSFILKDLNNSGNECANINTQYSNFLKKKRRKKDEFKYDIDGFDMGIIFKTATIYFNNMKIINYVDLRKTHLDCRFSDISKSNAIICLKKKADDEFVITSFILNDCMITIKNDEIFMSKEIKYEHDNDYIVAISFESIREELKNILKTSK